MGDARVAYVTASLPDIGSNCPLECVPSVKVKAYFTISKIASG